MSLLARLVRRVRTITLGGEPYEVVGDGATICMVTHDPRYTRYASREIKLFDGRVVDQDRVVVTA